jgi:predicted nucleic acid-binding protein
LRSLETDRAAVLAVFSDRKRVFVSSAAVRLEVLSKARFRKNLVEEAFYEQLFANVSHWVAIDEAIVERAIEIAAQHDITGLDAIHVALAEKGKVAEFITTERSTKPLFRAKQVGPVNLNEAKD